MKKLCLLGALTAILLFATNFVFAQSLLKLKKESFHKQNSDFEQLNKLNESAVRNFKKGDVHYNDCLELLLEAKNICDTISELNYNLGVCYFKTERKASAIAYFNTAISKNKNISEDIETLLGLCYQSNHQFDKAVSYYNQKLKLVKRKEINKQQEAFLVRKIQECENAINLPHHKEVCIAPVSGMVNSKFDEFDPYLEGDTLYYS